MELKDLSLSEFAEEVASSSPAPGGGSVAAYAGAQGYALVAMVCRLTLGRKVYADVHEELRVLLEAAAEKQRELLALVDEDTKGFVGVMEALRLPKNSEEEKTLRREALEQAGLKAAEIPLRTAGECLTGLEKLSGLIDKGNPNALSDLGVAALMFKAGLEGALYNVQINALGLKDPDLKKNLLEKCRTMRSKGGSFFEECQGKVLERLQ